MITYEITFNETSETGKFLIDYLNKNKDSFVINDQCQMNKEEFDTKCNESREQWKQGEFTRLSSKKDIDDFFAEFL